MSDKEKEFTVEQQKFLLEEFREIHKKIEETQRRQEELLTKIADNLHKLTETITRLEARLNTLTGFLPDLLKKGNGDNLNLWVALGQIINTILMVITLLKILQFFH